ncbi:DUF4440 domain-containing protein [Agromyces sp. LHK192]|uniref:YybH family protein n=1 Tax=Agromyces sp. LHK192 TaxID=2498704 RepID=UPI000FD9DE7C|nr:nuclear transport factor 2 family protein [Agromyces sp. LHK192]
MSDRDDFLAWLETEYSEAERAMLGGNAFPRRGLWSKSEPVSVLGAWRNGVGREAVVEAFDVLATSFSECEAFQLELISYDIQGDMAYTVGYERFTTSIDGKPRTVTLRATQVYRREDGEWRVVHRHADTTS